MISVRYAVFFVAIVSLIPVASSGWLCQATWGDGRTCLSANDKSADQLRQFQCQTPKINTTFTMNWGVGNVNSDISFKTYLPYYTNTFYVFSFPLGGKANGTIPIVRNDTHWQAQINLNYRKQEGIANKKSKSFKYSATETPSQKTVKVCSNGNCCLTFSEPGSKCTPVGGDLLEYGNRNDCDADEVSVVDDYNTFCLLKNVEQNTSVMTGSLEWANFGKGFYIDFGKSVSIACQVDAGSSSQVTDSPPN